LGKRTEKGTVGSRREEKKKVKRLNKRQKNIRRKRESGQTKVLVFTGQTKGQRQERGDKPKKVKKQHKKNVPR